MKSFLFYVIGLLLKRVNKVELNNFIKYRTKSFQKHFSVLNFSTITRRAHLKLVLALTIEQRNIKKKEKIINCPFLLLYSQKNKIKGGLDIKIKIE